MSNTEKEAIEAGEVWWDGELFSGHPNWHAFLKSTPAELTEEEQHFLNHQVEELCAKLNDWQMFEDNSNLSQDAWNYVKKEKFFGMIIPKSYGGLGFSDCAHSAVIAKIASRSLGGAVTIMVPNALGPAELLLKYGTEEQKNKYLPKLATGEEIPCFALTSEVAGSDATSITDTGIICKGHFQGQEVIGIKLNWDKRYITLSPIGTVLALAVQLYDPDRLIGEKEEVGITVCLIPTHLPGVEKGRRHCPLNTAFLNGPTKGKNVFIPLDYIIGGVKMAGLGWRMLVECLSQGRGISLPAVSTGNAMLAYRMTGAYARIRKQFNLPIGYFEGIEEALARIGGLTYQLEAARVVTIGALMHHIKPSVITAIVKFNMTEIARTIINDAMDIHGGKGIMMGPNNYLAFLYQGSPIGITVEGANILTRNLIIFGQGAIRSHPYVRQEINIATADYLSSSEKGKQFDSLLFKHVGYFISNVARVMGHMLTRGRILGEYGHTELKKYYRRVNWLSSALCVSTDLSLMILGGKLKRSERLSARLADVLGQLYLASAVLKYHYQTRSSEADSQNAIWALEYALYKAQTALLEFYRNFPYKWVGTLQRWITFGFKAPFTLPSDRMDKTVVSHMLNLSEFRDRITHLCYIGQSPDSATRTIEAALNKVVKAIPIEAKISDAIKNGKLAHNLPFIARVEEASLRGIITEHEAVLLKEMNRAVTNVVKVDDFDFNLKSNKQETKEHATIKLRE